ncbi:MAG: hypothetical protein RI973_2431 [Bacteroidota bacterium]|jgi:hypothetical protein
MKAIQIISLILLLPLLLQAQQQKGRQVYGNVFNQDGEHLIGATVQWDGTDIGTATDVNGDFWLPKLDTTAYLLIQYVGYDPVFIEVFPHEDSLFIKIEGITELQTVEITEHRGDVYTSTLDPVNMENITACELKKAACCNLAESFETSGSVDVMRQDAVTSASEVQMLGLRGIYSQLLLEKRPAYTGLGSPLALEYIPGSWVEAIQVSKGSSTVQNGPQSMTGQINIEMVKPSKDKPVFLNLFGSTTERGEVNLHLNKKWTPEMSSGLILHGSTTQGEFDRNKDSFLDQSLKKTLTGLWRNVYEGSSFYSQFNVQVLADERNSGQIRTGSEPANTEWYLIDQRNRRADVYGKFGYFGFDKPATSVALIYGGGIHDMDNTFGRTEYGGKQRNFYANLLYSSFVVTTDHKLNLGASYQIDDYDEQLNDTDFSHRETMPGVFGEYAYTGTKFGIIAGIRADHLEVSGVRGGQAPQVKTFVTPRLNLKYNFNDNTILRLSAGRGVRSAQFLPENLAVLASNRRIEVREDLRIEDAWNLGLNFTRTFKLAGRSASFLVDLYRTEFANQVVMDMESAHGKVLFYNLDGRSFANSLLLLATWAPFKGFDMKLAYKLNDVRVTYLGDLRLRPMTAPHRGLLTLNYETANERWMFNSHIQYHGWQRFAHASHLPASVEEKQHFEGRSPDYVLVNAQVTHKFKNLEIYLGGENLTDFRQEHAIIDWQDPFGEYFDAMQVWGPLVGARAHLGLRIWMD